MTQTRKFSQQQTTFLAARAALDIAKSDYAAEMAQWDHLLDADEGFEEAENKYDQLANEAQEKHGIYSATLALENAEAAMVEWAKEIVKNGKATKRQYKQHAAILEPLWTTYLRTVDSRRRMINLILSLEA